MTLEHQFKLAIAQSVISNDVAENGNVICDFVVRAADAGAKLVLFPEGALSGYAKAQLNTPEEFDHPEIRRQLDRIADCAVQHNIWVVVGACHDLGEHRPYNCQYVISDKGDFHLRNDKIYLSHTELKDWYTPGQDDPKFLEIDGFRFGFAICIEATMPHLFQQIELLDIDCVLYSSMANTHLFETLLRGHAAAFTYWIAISEPVQENQQLASMLINPNGEIESRLADRADGNLLVVTLNRHDLRFDTQLRLAKPWRRKAREGSIYQKITSRLIGSTSMSPQAVCFGVVQFSLQARGV